jgi:hypothetical protein
MAKNPKPSSRSSKSRTRMPNKATPKKRRGARVDQEHTPEELRAQIRAHYAGKGLHFTHFQLVEVDLEKGALLSERSGHRGHVYITVDVDGMERLTAQGGVAAAGTNALLAWATLASSKADGAFPAAFPLILQSVSLLVERTGRIGKPELVVARGELGTDATCDQVLSSTNMFGVAGAGVEVGAPISVGNTLKLSWSGLMGGSVWPLFTVKVPCFERTAEYEKMLDDARKQAAALQAIARSDAAAAEEAMQERIRQATNVVWVDALPGAPGASVVTTPEQIQAQIDNEPDGPVMPPLGGDAAAVAEAVGTAEDGAPLAAPVEPVTVPAAYHVEPPPAL